MDNLRRHSHAWAGVKTGLVVCITELRSLLLKLSMAQRIPKYIFLYSKHTSALITTLQIKTFA
jgi:hypothetical protein